MGVMWNPWHGCHKKSAGCLNCYVYFLDGRRDRDAGVVTRSKTNFYLPVARDRTGAYKLKGGQEIPTCFTSDFFIEEADAWREEAWRIIHSRPDVDFLICTKRIERFNGCLPPDWAEGYDNVIIAVSCENQLAADTRMPVFAEVKAKRKYVFVAPILEYVDLTPYLAVGSFDAVSVGGESYSNARECNFDWVKRIRFDCAEYGVRFDFHQTGSNFVKDGRRYRIKHADEYAQARKGAAALDALLKEREN